MSEAKVLEQSWKSESRWKGIVRPYSAEDVLRLRGSVQLEHTLARLGAERLWNLLHSEPYVATLGALTGNQAVQQVKAGLQAIYVSGWQVAADNNDSKQMYPDQSLYPVDSVPNLIRRINNAFLRADQIQHMQSGNGGVHWLAPIVADGEAGFGGPLNAFELTKAMIDSGVAGVHFEDQLSSAKKCGHMGGKVLLPALRFTQTLIAARLAADVCGIPTLIMARTDAHAAKLLTGDIDPRDHPFMTGERSAEGFYAIRPGIQAAIARGLAYAPYADLLWCETSEPDLQEAREFAEAIRKEFPEKLLAYNCSPSFNWKRKLDAASIAQFQRELGAMGYKFQFVTLAGFHALNYSMFELASKYKAGGMTGYAELQEREFAAEEQGYDAIRHQEFVGTSYFDEIAGVVSGGTTSTLAWVGSTEEEQFQKAVTR
ncbi:MAG: isocitrate lyase [Verrucomicrobia bacterium RIFCSPLOWO2_12_FULL_64_8]|nr:MAG: isocitrate lyase [Verrucomicrobia bacterium RIFCSPLOWO2_12_FULL_64_8]